MDVVLWEVHRLEFIAASNIKLHWSLGFLRVFSLDALSFLVLDKLVVIVVDALLALVEHHELLLLGVEARAVSELSVAEPILLCLRVALSKSLGWPIRDQIASVLPP